MSQNAELVVRLELVEQMISEGRRSQERWGWAFVLWGCGHVFALGAGTIWPGRSGFIWAVTMTACAALMMWRWWNIRLRSMARKVTSSDRTLEAVWLAFAISLGVLWTVGLRLHWIATNAQLFFGLFVLLGFANFISGWVLKWRVQSAVAFVWWGAAAVMALVPPEFAHWVFLGTALIAEVFFGIYLMVLERRDRVA